MILAGYDGTVAERATYVGNDPSGQGKEWNISIYTPVIVKYRDSKTDSSIRLEDLLR